MPYLVLKKQTAFEIKTCFTGQHKELCDEIVELFDIQIDYQLDAMKHNDSMANMMSYLIKSIQQTINEFRPELIIVQGDTLSSFCGAMVAFLNKIKLIHIEAGLRTFNKYAPFPEEIFRRFNDSLSDFHFAPTEISKSNLIKEGIKKDQIFVVGNTVVDALLDVKNKLDNNILKPNSRLKELIDSIKHSGRQIVLFTMHRRENREKLFANVVKSLSNFSKKHPVSILYLKHPHPLTNELLSQIHLDKDFHLLEPQNYQNFVWLMAQSDLILTDSGGVQEEAPYLGKQFLILRDETERPEVLEHGNALIDYNNFDADILQALDSKAESYMPFGEGQASQKIIEILKKLL